MQKLFNPSESMKIPRQFDCTFQVTPSLHCALAAVAKVVDVCLALAGLLFLAFVPPHLSVSWLVAVEESISTGVG